jgi:hypothetical protein
MAMLRPQQPGRVLTTEFTTEIVPKLHVVVLPAKRIRRMPAPGLTGEGDPPPDVVEIFARRRRRNTETGEIVSDTAPDWHPLDEGKIAWAQEDIEKLPVSLCDVIARPISCCYNPRITDAQGNPQRSVINLTGIEIYRIDYETLTGAHENNLMGRHSAPPPVEEPPVEPPALVTP